MIDDDPLLAILKKAYAEQDEIIRQQIAAVTAGSGFTLFPLCFACPESYDVKLGDRQAGHLRLRHGVFTVECPDAGGQRVLEVNPAGDGIFDDGEREKYLRLALSAIGGWILAQQLPQGIR